MKRPMLVLRAAGFGVVVLLSGCGSSSHSPVIAPLNHDIHTPTGSSERSLYCSLERNRRIDTLRLECCVRKFASWAHPQQGRRFVGHSHCVGWLFI